jgi:hypothetical protein
MNKRYEVVPARQARIEYLRARAAYERETLAFHTSQLGRELSPRRWLGGLLGHSRNDDAQVGGRSGFAELLGQGVSLAGQYPYLTATLSSLLIGKRWRWLKWFGVGVAVWQAVAATPQETQQPNSGSVPEA